MQIRIGHLSTSYHTAILLMADKGLCSGIDAEIAWKLFGTGPAIVHAFEKKAIDLAYLGLPPAIIGIERGIPIICVAGGHVEGTVFCGKDTFSGFPDVRDFEAILRQFRGMRIGVPGKGSIHDVILQESLQRFRLKKDIAVTNFPWADQVTEAMVKNEISAAFGTPALAVAVRRFAGGRILYPPSLLWPHNPSYGILVDKGYLHAHQEIVGQFLRAHEQATFLIRNRPAAAARIISDHLGFIEEDFVLETLRISPKYCAQLTGEYVASAMGFVKILRDLSYIAREIPVADIFERSLINSIHPEKDHYENGIAPA